MKTKGVILNHTSVSQLNIEVFKSLNKLSSNNDSICAFYKNLTPVCMQLDFGLFGLGHIHDVDSGVIVATDLDSAEVLINSTTKANKIFYVWDLEWIHDHNKRDFLHNVSIYRNIKLYTRSDSYANIIQNYCNIKPEITSIEGVLNVI